MLKHIKMNTGLLNQNISQQYSLYDTVYREEPRRVVRLDNAYRLESKTRQFPFVVANELGVKKSAAHNSVRISGNSSDNSDSESNSGRRNSSSNSENNSGQRDDDYDKGEKVNIKPLTDEERQSLWLDILRGPTNEKLIPKDKEEESESNQPLNSKNYLLKSDNSLLKSDNPLLKLNKPISKSFEDFTTRHNEGVNGGLMTRSVDGLENNNERSKNERNNNGGSNRSRYQMEAEEDERDNQQENTSTPIREFLIFHDIDHFLYQKHLYPNTHEVVRCPSRIDNSIQFQRKIFLDDSCRGRLIFDFDLKKPMSSIITPVRIDIFGTSANSKSESSPAMDPQNFVPSNFKMIIEYLIVEVFRIYYKNVDISKLIFVWQRSLSLEKFSMHLIVKNAFFSEHWVKQMRIFYILMERVAHERKQTPILEAVDFQIPRRNATFRMIGSSKIGGSSLELIAYNNQGRNLLETHNEVSIYDCLVGIYDSERMRNEQRISLENLDYSLLESQIKNVEVKNGEANDFEKKFKVGIKKQVNLVEDFKVDVDFDDDDIRKAVGLFDAFNDGTFKIRDQVGNIINLDRCRSGECPISKRIHDSDNAYLKLTIEGNLVFYCRRGCRSKTGYGLDLGVFRSPKEKGVMVNPQRVQKVMELSVVMNHNPTHCNGMKINHTPDPVYVKTRSGARRVPIGTNKVVVPNNLRVQKVIVLTMGGLN